MSFKNLKECEGVKTVYLWSCRRICPSLYKRHLPHCIHWNRECCIHLTRSPPYCSKEVHGTMIPTMLQGVNSIDIICCPKVCPKTCPRCQIEKDICMNYLKAYTNILKSLPEFWPENWPGNWPEIFHVNWIAPQEQRVLVIVAEWAVSGMNHVYSRV